MREVYDLDFLAATAREEPGNALPNMRRALDLLATAARRDPAIFPIAGNAAKHFRKRWDAAVRHRARKGPMAVDDETGAGRL